jgi:Holliday junction DNA helicase RuvA
MIALLQGEVAARHSDHVVVLCGSVGYRAAVSAETLRHVPAVGEQVSLHAHLIVRDDALALYGFHSESERELFLMLLSVQAVGPKVALGVLSAGPPAALLQALAAGDAGRFQAVPGIGKRTAERIIVELRNRVDAVEKVRSEEIGGLGARPGDDSSTRMPIVARRGQLLHPRSLAREGLIELGYQPGEAEELLAGVQADGADGLSAEELISGALRLARSPS